MTNKPDQQSVTDAKFLVDEFGLPENRAAGLVSDQGAERDAVADAVRKQNAEADPLDDKAVPDSDDKEQVRDSQDRLLKPVVHTSNDRTGA